MISSDAEKKSSITQPGPHMRPNFTNADVTGYKIKHCLKCSNDSDGSKIKFG